MKFISVFVILCKNYYSQEKCLGGWEKMIAIKIRNSEYEK